MTGVPDPRRLPGASMIAVSCGTPTPATTRVVQIEPGPMPTFTASAPAPISALVASAVATLPATIWTAFEGLADPLDRGGDVAIVAVRGVDDDQVAFGVDQRLRALEALVADRGRGGDAQPPGAVLGRVGIGDRFLDVLDGDQADAAARPRRPPAISRSGAGGAGGAPPPG